MANRVQRSFDLILVGGGLANSLIAYRLKLTRPALRVLVIEREARLGGNHTWSFHATDLTPGQHDWVAPLVVHRWPHYDVRFPGHERRVGIGYLSITSERLANVVGSALGGDLLVNCNVAKLDATWVEITGAERRVAAAVVDGRGNVRTDALVLRFQKFFGQELLLGRPHGLSGPVVMDACVDQQDGYRFVYVLPFAPDRVLVEDTFYSDAPQIDSDSARLRIAAYAAARGWGILKVVREESGVLPITLGGDPEALWSDAPGVPRAGLRAGLFHPTTGYSLADAVRLADRLAALADLSARSVYKATRDASRRQWQRQGFFRMLNRMLFLAGRPTERYRVLRHFYGMHEALIARFYAGDLRWHDKVRLLCGAPPVPVAEAMRVMAESAATGARGAA